MTLISLSDEWILLPIWGGGGELIGWFICPVPLLLLESCRLRSDYVGVVGTRCKIFALSKYSSLLVKVFYYSVKISVVYF